MKQLYLDIRNQLESETSVTHVRLWNNQIELSEKGEQIPFQFPACFIDFPNISWAQKGKGTQSSDNLNIRVYVCFESFATSENEEDLALFDLRSEVYLALNDYKPTGAGPLQRIAETTDTNHTNVYVWIMDFTTSYQDKVAEYPRNSELATITTITLNGDMIIDPNTVDGVRTDKDFN